uniref:Uncharacterized protein n=1 Tax=Lygus hesperus TaxID=30085 RepID=A0A146LXH6_LYGHE
MFYVSLVLISWCGFCYNFDAAGASEPTCPDCSDMVKQLGSHIHSMRTANGESDQQEGLKTVQKRAAERNVDDVKNNSMPSTTAPAEDEELPDDVANEGDKIQKSSPGAALIVAPKRRCPNGLRLELRTGICRKIW